MFICLLVFVVLGMEDRAPAECPVPAGQELYHWLTPQLHPWTLRSQMNLRSKTQISLQRVLGVGWLFDWLIDWLTDSELRVTRIQEHGFRLSRSWHVPPWNLGGHRTKRQSWINSLTNILWGQQSGKLCSTDSCFYRFFSLFETGSPNIALAGLVLIHGPDWPWTCSDSLAFSSECWNYRCGVCAISARGIRWFHDILNFCDGRS